MPLVLLLIAIFIVSFDKFIPIEIYQYLYGISLIIKSLIISLLPFIIFSLLFKAAINLANNATRIIGLILICVCCSSLMALFVSHLVGVAVYNCNLSIFLPESSKGLEPIWIFEFPKFISNDKAMLAGIILGIVANFKKLAVFNKFLVHISIKLEFLVFKFFKIFIYLIPLFVAGFIAKLQHDKLIILLVKDYTLIFSTILLAQFCYILLIYFCVNNFNIKKLCISLQNMLPAAISGFSTMSSAASMPLTIVGAENNAKFKDLAHSIIPATVNIHLVGDCFTTPILAYAVIRSYSMPEPLLLNYFMFVVYFVIAKFSVAGIPGGGIIVMLPILESYLGFNSEMMSLITALYILFDPINTCINVLGNGAFAKMIDNIIFYWSRKKSRTSQGSYR